LHGLCDRGIRIEAMALENVDIVELKTLQGSFDCFEYVLCVFYISRQS
jgi:hypothetical protein